MAKPLKPKTGPRPHLWVTGPDPLRHEQHTAWARARAQAHFRGEDWRLSFAAWERLWQGQWHLRGRTKHSIMLVRKDWHKPWSERNCYLVTRKEFHRRQILMKIENGTIGAQHLENYETP